MKTVAAREVGNAELVRLEEVAASFGEESEIGAALDVLVGYVKSGRDALVAGPEDLVTPAQGAKILGMSRTHLYKVLDSRELPFVYVGRDRRIALADLVAFGNRRERERSRLAERFAHKTVAREAIIDELVDDRERSDRR